MVVPKDISDPRGTAEKLYQFFYSSLDAEEAAEKEEAGNEGVSQNASSTAIQSESSVEMAARKDEIIASYLKKLDKPGDPYESLEKKMDSADLLKLFAFLALKRYD
jgi:hypothetical protein